MCRETHPKFSSPTHKQGKEKPFVPNRHHQIVIVKAALDAPSPHSMIQSTARLRICHQAHGAAVDEHQLTFSVSLSPR